MTLLLRSISRLFGVAAIAVLAVAGLAVAVFSLGSGDGTFSLPGGLALIEAPEALDQTRRLVGLVTTDGSTATLTLQWAAVAAAAALVVVIGGLLPRRERLVRFRVGDREVRVRRRALAAMATHVVQQDSSVGRARGRARPRRWRPGAVIRVKVSPGLRRVEPLALRRLAHERLEPLTGPLAARSRVKVKGDS